MFFKPTEPIETPALLIDMDAVERNIQTMNDFVQRRNISLRPHFKSTKIPEIAQMQVSSGAIGITCAKLSEAEVLADAGVEDIFIANQVVSPNKIERLAILAGRVRSLAVAVDNVHNVHRLSEACVRAGATLNVMVELDVGMGRCGVRNYEEGLAVCSAALNAPHLKFEGIQAYEGHLSLISDQQVLENGVAKLFSYVGGFKSFLIQHGFSVKVIAGGGTSTYAFTGTGDVYTELQPGSYIYMDTRYGNLDIPFEYALFVLGMVISKQPGLAIIDAGLKSFTVDSGKPLVIGFEQNDLRLNEEHSLLDDPNDMLTVGDTIMFIPSYCGTNINMYDTAYGVRKGHVEQMFDVKGRGKCQ